MTILAHIDVSGYVVTAISDFSLWNSPNVVNLANMFKDCSTFVGIGLPLWNTDSVTNMSGMLQNCPHFNQDLSRWDTSMVTTMNSMFQNDICFNSDISRWNIASLVDASGMLDNTGMSSQNLSMLLYRWGLQPDIHSGVVLGTQNLQYYKFNSIFINNKFYK